MLHALLKQLKVSSRMISPDDALPYLRSCWRNDCRTDGRRFNWKKHFFKCSFKWRTEARLLRIALIGIETIVRFAKWSSLLLLHLIIKLAFSKIPTEGYRTCACCHNIWALWCDKLLVTENHQKFIPRCLQQQQSYKSLRSSNTQPSFLQNLKGFIIFFFFFLLLLKD